MNVEDNTNDVTILAVDLQNWSSDTTSQSGSTLYKKTISLNNVYVESPNVDIGAGTGYVLPTLAEQTSYDLLQYVTVDSAVPCLYLYASAIPTTAFYIIAVFLSKYVCINVCHHMETMIIWVSQLI